MQYNSGSRIWIKIRQNGKKSQKTKVANDREIMLLQTFKKQEFVQIENSQ
jgi:hypothetical protein